MTEYAGVAYAKLIEDELSRHDDLERSLESRGTWVVTSAAALGTLFGAIALISDLPDALAANAIARSMLMLAVALFGCAALFGVATNWPMKYESVSAAAMDRLLDTHYWNGPIEVGTLRTSEARRRQFAAAFARNRIKARLLVTGFAFEVAGVTMLAGALSTVVI